MNQENKQIKLIGSASITYEAALVLPLFIGVLIFFLSFYQLMAAQEILSSASYYAAEEASLYGFLYQGDTDEEGADISVEEVDSSESFQLFLLNNLQQIAGRTISSLYFNFRIGLLLNENHINSYFIKGGINGISFAGSEVLADDLVIIKIKYYYIVPIFQKLIPPVEVTQNIIMRSFTGHYVPLKNEEKPEEEKVYIAKSGNVYHVDRNCTYIKLSIQEEAYSKIKELHNKNNKKYYECSVCKDQAIINDKIYVTDHGDRYHTTLKCRSIKRSVTAVAMSEIDEKRPCKKCAGGGMDQE